VQVRSIAFRSSLQGEGLEAKSVLVVDMDNQDFSSARYVAATPAPQVGDPLHYDAFIQAVSSLYLDRFA
jgi:hypothetical protein